jgi:hypothetical protein
MADGCADMVSAGAPFADAQQLQENAKCHRRSRPVGRAAAKLSSCLVYVLVTIDDLPGIPEKWQGLYPWSVCRHLTDIVSQSLINQDLGEYGQTSASKEHGMVAGGITLQPAPATPERG